MAVTINGQNVNVGDEGTYYSTDGKSYPAEVVKIVEQDATYLYALANTGVELEPDTYCVIRVEEFLVMNPLVVANGARVNEVHCFELNS